jgi:hypothetical protein
MVPQQKLLDRFLIEYRGDPRFAKWDYRILHYRLKRLSRSRGSFGQRAFWDDVQKILGKL